MLLLILDILGSGKAFTDNIKIHSLKDHKMSGIDVDDSSVARMALCYMFFLTSFITSSGLLYPKHIFAHNQALVNTVCPSKDVVLNVTLESGIHCSAMCTRTGTCRSFMYNRDLKQCVLCRETFSSSGELTNANGFQLYSDTTSK